MIVISQKMMTQRNSYDANRRSAPIVTQEDIDSIEKALDQKLEFLERSIDHYTANVADMKSKMNNRCSKMKETKKMIIEYREQVQDMQKTLDDLNKSKKELTEYVKMLKADAEMYAQENVRLAEEQRQKLEDAETKWTIFKAKYEMLPLAVVRNKEEIALSKVNIELMVKQNKLSELRKIIDKREEIDKKRRNNLVIECAGLYREAKLEDVKMRTTLERWRNLQEELRRQEAMLEELRKKQGEGLAASRQSAARKPDQRMVPLFTTSQRQCPPIPSFDISTLIGPRTQPTPIFRKDYYDTISITSSVIDGLMETGKLPLTETKKFVPSKPVDLQENDQTLGDDDFLGSNQKTNTGEQDRQIPPYDQRKVTPATDLLLRDVDNQEVIFQRSQTDSTGAQLAYQIEDHGLLEKPEEVGAAGNCDHANKEPLESTYPTISDAEREKPGRSFVPESELEQRREPGEAETKRPRITAIEKVQLNVTPRKPISAKPLQDDSLARYFGASDSSVDFNWKPNYPPSFFSITDSQRDADMESILDSEASIQPADIIKQFHVMFSPERRDEDGDASSVDNNPTSRTAAGPLNIGQSRAATQFLDMNHYAPPNRRDNNKEPFFLKLF